MGTGSKMITWLALMVGQTGPAPEHVKQRAFTIPIQLDAASQAQFERLVLYVSTDGGRSWNQEAVAPPNQNEFSYKAPADGKYAFLLQSINKQGQASPKELGDAEPHLVIVVDTKPPLIKLNAGERNGADVTVSWQIIEEHLQARSLKLEYRTADNPTWQAVKVDAPSAVSFKKINVGSNAAVTVRLSVNDVGGNADVAEVECKAAANVTLTSNPGTVAPPALDPPPSGPIVPPVPVDPPIVPKKPGFAPADPPPPKKPAFEPIEMPKALPPAPLESGPKVIAKSDWTPVGKAPDPLGPGIPPVGPAPAEPVQPRPKGGMPALQYANNPRIDLDYKVGQVGPSGLKAAELWVTTDDGKSWRKYSDDPDLQSPISADLPGEGVYGFILLLRSGAGLARPDPVAGETPQMRLEIDTTPPACTLYQVEADPRRPEFLHLLWNVTDRNLSARPITIKWADKPNGDWQTIAADIENKGRYAWQIPQGLPFKFYLRTEAKDVAGNVGVATTPDPVLVDLHIPSADLTGVAPKERK